MHAVSKVSEKSSSMARGTILLMLCSLIVSALVSFGAVRFFFVIKADIKAQAVRREEGRKNRELEANANREETASPRADSEHHEMLMWEHEQKVKRRQALENLDYADRQNQYRNRNDR